MIHQVFKYIDKIIDNKEINKNIKEKIFAKEKELGIKIPNILKKFYIRYSGNESVLSSFYILNDIDRLSIEDNILIIGHTNEFINKFGIVVEELSNESININVRLLVGRNKWITYENLEDFIVNTVVFQSINMLEASVQLDDSEIKIEKFFTPLNILDNKSLKRISYISKDKKILALHFIEDNVIYFGSNTDEVLEEFEEHADVEFDWL